MVEGPSYPDSFRRSSPSSGIVPRFSPNLAWFDKKGDRAFVEKGDPPIRQEGKPMELTNPVKRILDNYESDMLGKIIKIYQGKD